jgi:lysophospholipase L1-like esterase
VLVTALFTLATSVAGAGVAVASEPESAPLNAEYVALGDSFAAGPLIFPQETGGPCYRSSVNYPHLLAESINAKVFRDVTCSSATTDNVLTTPQPADPPSGPAQPIQLDALSPTTTLVTLTIGANDADLAGIAGTCISLLPPPLGRSCKAEQTAGGVDRGAQAIDAVGPRLALTLDAVHAAAPQARVVITSYARYLRPGGCYPLQPTSPQDSDYVQGLVDRLGKLTAKIAAAHDAEYVDFIGPGLGHDGCALTRNWVNWVTPGTTLGLAPIHPTALGERNFARILAEHLADVDS